MTDPTKIVISGEDKSGRAISSAIGGLNKLSGASEVSARALQAVFGAITVGGMAEMVRSTANAADAISKLGQRTGVSVERLSELKFAAEINGATFREFEQGLKGLSNRMLDAARGSGDAADTFDALGIKVTDAGGAMRPLEAVLDDLADAFASSADGAAKSAIANKLMEESGVRLIPALNNGADGLRALGDEARALGVTFTDDAAQASVQFNDNMTRLGAVSRSLAITFGNQLIPTLSAITEEMVVASRGMGDMSDSASGLDDVLVGLYRIGLGAATGFTLMGKAIGGVAAALAVLAEDDGFAKAGRIIDEMLADMDATAQRAATSMERVSTRAREHAAAAGESARGADTLSRALAELSGKSDRQTRATKAANAAEKARNKALAEAKKLLDDIRRNQAEGERSALDELRTLEDQVAARVRQNEEIGLTAEALSDLRAERLRATAAQKDETAAALDAIEPGSLLAQTYRNQAAALRELAERQREGDVAQASTEAATAALDAWDTAATQIGDVLFDSITGAGADAADALKGLFDSLVLRPAVQQASRQFAPDGQYGAYTTAIGVGANLYQAFDSGSQADQAQAVGAAIGSIWGPIGTVVGSILGSAVGGMLTGGTVHHGGAALFSDGRTVLANDNNVPNFGLDWGAYRSDRRRAVDDVVVDLLSGLGTGLAGLGVDTSELSIAARFAADGEDTSRGGLRVTDAAGSVIFDLSKEYASDFERGFEQFARDASRAALSVVQAASGDLDPIAAQLAASLDPATASVELINELLKQLSEYERASAAIDAFGSLENVLDEVAFNGLTAFGQLQLSSQRLREAAASGALSVEDLVGGLERQYSAQVALLSSIDATSTGIADSFEASIRSIRLSVLDAEGQYEFLDAEAQRYLDTLRSLTDPALIQDYAARLQGSITQGFNVLSPEQRQSAAPEFVALLEEANAVAQERLDAARDAAVAEQRELADIMAQAIRGAFGDVEAGLEQVARAIPRSINVGVTVDSPVPAQAEVGMVAGN